MFISKQQVTALYVAAFGRAPDSHGLNYWIEQGQTDFSLLAANFVSHPVFEKTYQDLNQREFVQALYRSVLKEAGDKEGIDYWTAYLGQVTTGQFLARFIEAVLDYNGTDGLALLRQQAFMHQIEVGLYFVEQMAQYSNLSPVIDVGSLMVLADSRYQLAQAVLANVGADSASVELAKKEIDRQAAIARGEEGVPPPNDNEPPDDTEPPDEDNSTPQVKPFFSLTTGIDNLMGTEADEVFEALVVSGLQTINDGDVIDGGMGRDELHLELNEFAALFDAVGEEEWGEDKMPVKPTLRHIEEVYIRSTGGGNDISLANALDLNLAQNIEQINIDSKFGLLLLGVQQAQVHVSNLQSWLMLEGITSQTLTLGLTQVGTVQESAWIDLLEHSLKHLKIESTGARSYLMLAAASYEADEDEYIYPGFQQLESLVVQGDVTLEIDLFDAVQLRSVEMGSGDDLVTFSAKLLQADSDLVKIDLGGGVNTLYLETEGFLLDLTQLSLFGVGSESRVQNVSKLVVESSSLQGNLDLVNTGISQVELIGRLDQAGHTIYGEFDSLTLDVTESGTKGVMTLDQVKNLLLRVGADHWDDEAGVTLLSGKQLEALTFFAYSDIGNIQQQVSLTLNVDRLGQPSEQNFDALKHVKLTGDDYAELYVDISKAIFSQSVDPLVIEVGALDTLDYTGIEGAVQNRAEILRFTSADFNAISIANFDTKVAGNTDVYDRLDLSGLGVSSMDDLQITTQGGTSFVDFGANVVELQGVDKHDLTAEHFIFN